MDASRVEGGEGRDVVARVRPREPVLRSVGRWLREAYAGQARVARRRDRIRFVWEREHPFYYLIYQDPGYPGGLAVDARDVYGSTSYRFFAEGGPPEACRRLPALLGAPPDEPPLDFEPATPADPRLAGVYELLARAYRGEATVVAGVDRVQVAWGAEWKYGWRYDVTLSPWDEGRLWILVVERGGKVTVGLDIPLDDPDLIGTLRTQLSPPPPLPPFTPDRLGKLGWSKWS